MILRRIGNKAKVAKEITKHFPAHVLYIEPFFGAGGMFFNKPRARHNIVNDLDSDVYNLFMVFLNQKDELVDMFKRMPIHSDLLAYWKQNKETDPLKKALRFLFLSNFSLYGKGNTVRFSATKDKQMFLDNLDKAFNKLQDVQFMNLDFRKAIKVGSADTRVDKKDMFIYADPPYLSTDDNYSNSFTKQDSIDLFDTLKASGAKYAMSEFDNPFILQQAKERGLYVTTIGSRINLKNRRTEILVTNYSPQLTLF